MGRHLRRWIQRGNKGAERGAHSGAQGRGQGNRRWTEAANRGEVVRRPMVRSSSMATIRCGPARTGARNRGRRGRCSSWTYSRRGCSEARQRGDGSDGLVRLALERAERPRGREEWRLGLDAGSRRPYPPLLELPQGHALSIARRERAPVRALVTRRVVDDRSSSWAGPVTLLQLDRVNSAVSSNLFCNSNSYCFLIT